MLYEVLEFGSPLLWTIILIDAGALVVLDSMPRIGLTIGTTVVFGAFTNMIDVFQIQPDLMTVIRILEYLGIGLLTFIFLYSINIRLIRKDLREYARKHKLSDREMGKALDDKYSGVLPVELYNRYDDEPSWTGFYDRLFCWPIAIPNFFLGDFLRSFASSAAKWLIQRRKNIVGFEVDDDK